jgi:hypothetical protein
MAVTYTATVEQTEQVGNSTFAWGTLAASGTYTAGGDAITVAGIENLRVVRASGGGRLLEFVPAGSLLQVKAWATAGATVAASEITAGTSLTGESYTFFAVGQ